MRQINWENLLVNKFFRDKEDGLSRGNLFMRMGSTLGQPREELNFIVKHFERKGLIEKFRMGNGDYFYRRMPSSPASFKP